MTEEKILATGMQFPEGPAFDHEGRLFVVELAAGQVTRLLEDGTKSVAAKMGGSPNGLAFGPDRYGYVCNGGGRWAPEKSTGGDYGPGDSPSLIQRMAPDGSFETYIEEIDGVALNAPNDLCFDDQGGFYFTDPVWPDFSDPDALQKGLPPGSVCYSPASGDPIRCHTGINFPNGLGVTEDGKTLIVCESGTSKLLAFDIDGPGKLANLRDFSQLDAGVIPDGMCFDGEGRILVAGHGSSTIFVVAPDGGEPIQRIAVNDKDVTNLCFGGERFSTLFITESDNGRVVTMEWDVPGMVLFPFR